MEPTNKRQRVSKGNYNQYLKRKDPFQHAPISSKRHLDQRKSEVSINEGISTPPRQNQGRISTGWSEFQQLHSLLEPVEQLDGASSPTANEPPPSQGIVETETDIDFTPLDIRTHVEPSDNGYHYQNLEQLPLEENESIFEQETNTKDKNNDQIFPQSRLSLGSFMVLVMSFVLKYSLTGEALGELLRIFDLLCPSDNLLIKTIASFKKWFHCIKNPLIVHKYCNFCHIGVNEQDLLSKTCPNVCCKKALDETSISHFIEIPIADQIKSFFSRPTFKTDIKHRFTRSKKIAQAIEDIYDGQIYRKLSKKGQILENQNNLSLLWNTDGIPCFKSSNMSLWPLFFQINELQYNKRSHPENMILGGLWFGPKKPTMMSYTEPFVKTLQELETTGVQIKTSSETFNCKVTVIGGTADLPAKSTVCNTMQFNGKYGCSKCLQPGETYHTSQRGHCHIFPFKNENPCGPKRCHSEFLEDVNKAVSENIISRGIEGPSFLQCLSNYNLVSGTCIDYMHGVLLGVTKLLMCLWFLPEHSGKLFSLSSYVGIVDRRLNNIKPPNNISRLPRSIKDHLKYWKASEFRSWLLYYSIPVLRDIQQNDYFQHYLLFVNVIYILLQDSILPADIDKADALMKHFCCLFAALYDDRYMTCNVHQLLHLPDMVYQMGPLWAYSCFSFENANGSILKLFNGTQNVDFQIVETVNLLQTMPKLQKQFLKPESPENILFQTIKGTLDRNHKYLQDNVHVVGGSGKRKLSVMELEAVSLFLGHVPEHYVTFKRVRIGSEIFHSRSYRKVHARNSYTVSYKTSNGDRQICQIAFYMQLFPFCEKHPDVKKCKCNVVNVAVVNGLEKNTDKETNTISSDTLSGADVAHIDVLHPVCLETFHLVPIENILYKCVFIEFKDKNDVVYACKMPNHIEID